MPLGIGRAPLVHLISPRVVKDIGPSPSERLAPDTDSLAVASPKRNQSRAGYSRNGFQEIISIGTWGNKDTQGLWAPWTGFGCSYTPDRAGGPDSWVHDLSTGRSYLDHMMNFSTGGFAVQS